MSEFMLRPALRAVNCRLRDRQYSMVCNARALIAACLAVLVGAAMSLAAISDARAQETAQEVPTEAQTPTDAYILGPGDTIQIFVWRSAELTETIFVRPDGRITTRLLEDLQAAGRTPTELAREIEDVLAAFVQTPIVTVIVTEIGAGNQQNVKVLGQAIRPSQLVYYDGMTVLDVIVSVGGLTEVADGNGAVLVRQQGDERVSIPLRLDDLLSEGDLAADVPVRGGDTIIIPESWL